MSEIVERVRLTADALLRAKRASGAAEVSEADVQLLCMDLKAANRAAQTHADARRASAAEARDALLSARRAASALRCAASDASAEAARLSGDLRDAASALGLLSEAEFAARTAGTALFCAPPPPDAAPARRCDYVRRRLAFEDAERTAAAARAGDLRAAKRARKEAAAAQAAVLASLPAALRSVHTKALPVAKTVGLPATALSAAVASPLPEALAAVRAHLHACVAALPSAPASGVVVRVLPAAPSHAVALELRGGAVSAVFRAVSVENGGVLVGVSVVPPQQQQQQQQQSLLGRGTVAAHHPCAHGENALERLFPGDSEENDVLAQLSLPAPSTPSNQKQPLPQKHVLALAYRWAQRLARADYSSPEQLRFVADLVQRIDDRIAANMALQTLLQTLSKVQVPPERCTYSGIASVVLHHWDDTSSPPQMPSATAAAATSVMSPQPEDGEVIAPAPAPAPAPSPAVELQVQVHVQRARTFRARFRAENAASIVALVDVPCDYPRAAPTWRIELPRHTASTLGPTAALTFATAEIQVNAMRPAAADASSTSELLLCQLRRMQAILAAAMSPCPPMMGRDRRMGGPLLHVF